jgi:hypothetical protein
LIRKQAQTFRVENIGKLWIALSQLFLGSDYHPRDLLPMRQNAQQNLTVHLGFGFRTEFRKLCFLFPAQGWIRDWNFSRHGYRVAKLTIK